ncbi:MAG: hypothetical protein ACMUHM_05095 [Thermoplasmatota archaeon]
MKEQRFKLTGCLSLVIMAMLLVLASPGISIDMEQGGWQRPSIDSVEVSLLNSTGRFSLAFTATGSAPSGTETVNVTFGTLNGTELQLVENMWFREGGFIFLGNGVSLEADGNVTEPWSEWTFKIRVTLPYNGDPMSIVDAVQWMLPDEIDNSTLEDIELDPENLTRLLADMEFFFVARAFNDTGSWGQEAFDITAHVQTAVLQFMIDEGYLDDPNSKDDDTEPDDDTGDDKKGVSQGLILALGIGGVILLIAAVIIAVFLLTTRSRKL